MSRGNWEKAMTTHSSTLAWKIPWTEEPGRLQSMGLLRIRHDWAASLHFSLSCTREGNGNPLQCSCLENPRDGGAWWAAIYGVAQSWTWLKRLSSSSSSSRGNWVTATGILWVEAMNAKYPTVHTLPHTTKNYFAQNIISVKGEKHILRPDLALNFYP